MTKDVEQAVSNAIDYIAAHWQDQPSLDFLAQRAGYESTHFQKTFTRMVGLSPKNLVQFMNARYARELLLTGYSTLDAAYETGLSGTGRLFDAMLNVVAATPGEVKRKGAGLNIHYGFHPTPLGEVLIAQTDRGLCWLGFAVDEERTVPMARLHKDWPMANLIHDDAVTKPTAEKIMNIWRGADDRLTLHLYGTNFQMQVWQALLKIPCGATVSYQAVAEYIGRPKAFRAVGTAVGANPVSLLIPCHRVIQATGIVENYGWGTPRKKLILALEGEGPVRS